jgi:putative transposase
MSYSTDLTETQWTRIAPYFAQAPGRGRRRQSDIRAVVNALRYRLRTGCQWRLLPKEYPDWRLVYYYFKTWTRSGTLERVQATLREQTRRRQGRKRRPSAAIIDSQSAKGTHLSYASGFDGGKKGERTQAPSAR